MTKTSANLSYREADAVTITIKCDVDQMLYIAAGLTLIPKASFATVVDASADVQAFCHAFLTAINQTQGNASLINN